MQPERHDRFIGVVFSLLSHLCLSAVLCSRRFLAMPLRALVVVLAVLALVSTARADPLWNEAAGDNANVMSMFLPQPPQQQQTLQQPNPQAAQLIAQVASLLQAAAQTQQQPQQQQQQHPQAVAASPYRNLYGARAPAARAPAQDSSFLARGPAAARDTILPLARAGTSGYLFSASHPPAEVVAARRRTAPRHVSSLEMFGRIPRPHVQKRRLSGLNRLINLEKDTRRAPNRALPRPSAQKRFRLRSPRGAPHVDARHMKRVLSSNPFLAKLQPDGSDDATTEFIELATELDAQAPADADSSDARVLQELDAQADAVVDAEGDAEFEADADADADAEPVSAESHRHLSAVEADALEDANLDAAMADEMAQF